MRYLVVDLEGTCSNTNSIPDDERETIEIGAVIVSSEYRVIAAYSELIRPVRHPQLTEFCTELTGINQKDVDAALPFSVAFPRFVDWIESFEEMMQFASWGKYDLQQFERDCKYHEIDYPFKTYLNLSKAFQKKTGRRKGHRGAMKVLGIEPEGKHHRGLDDALNIAKTLPYILEDD